MKDKTVMAAAQIRLALIALGATLMVCGCMTTAARQHPEYRTRSPQISKLLCIAPEITVVSEKDAGLILMASESRSASAEIFAAIVRRMTEKGYAVALADEKTMAQPDVRSMTALFRVVNRSIQLHAYGPQIMPSKLTLFDYTVGPVDDLLNAYGADALVLSMGQQTESTVVSKTWLSIAIVAPNGRVLWYGLDGAKESLALQETGPARALVEKTLVEMAEVKRGQAASRVSAEAGDEILYQ